MKPYFFIGIDLGGTNLKIALLDDGLHIKDRHVLSTRHFKSRDNLIEAIVQSTKATISGNALKPSQIKGVGIGLPGPVDAENGLVHFFPNIPGWRAVPLKDMLESRLHRVVFLDNDANLMALAEQRLGAAKGFKNVVCVTLGTGVGGGIIIENKLYRGSSFTAGEIGHLPINEKGPRCNCGGVACLEAYIGNRAILTRAKKLFHKKTLTLEELSALAKKRNRRAEDIWYNVGAYLGIALAATVNLLNPDAIVIGGGVANAGKALFDGLKATLRKRAMSVQSRHVKIYKASLGSDAGMVGAAILVKESLHS